MLDFTCKICGNQNLYLVRKEKTSLSLEEGQEDFDYGKESVIDCEISELQCGEGHTLTLKNGNVVDDYDSYVKWLKENEKWVKSQKQE